MSPATSSLKTSGVKSVKETTCLISGNSREGAFSFAQTTETIITAAITLPTILFMKHSFWKVLDDSALTIKIQLKEDVFSCFFGLEPG
jgi:hypothetical protein